MADLGRSHHLLKDDAVYFFRNLHAVYVGIFNLFFDVFFFVCEEVVNVTITLDVGLALKTVQCFFDFLTKGSELLMEVLKHQNAKIVQGWFELAVVFDEKECL